MKILIAALLVSWPLLASKTEDDLRRQLATTQAQLAAAAQERAALARAINKLNADGAKRSAAILQSNKSTDASAIKAATATSEIKEQVEQGNDAVAVVDEKLANYKKEIDRGHSMLMFSGVIGFLGLMIPVMLALVKIWSIKTESGARHQATIDQIALTQVEAHRAALAAEGTVEEMHETKVAVRELEVNTNHKMDELLKVSTESAFAAGRAQGRQEIINAQRAGTSENA